MTGYPHGPNAISEALDILFELIWPIVRSTLLQV
jgi:hypothetical protein